MRLLLFVVFVLFPCFCLAAPNAPTGVSYGTPTWPTDGTLTNIIFGQSIEDWKVNAFLGNFATANEWYDGPRLEVGTLNDGASCEQGNGFVYCSFNYSNAISEKVAEVNETTGAVRTLMYDTGTWTGPIGEVRGGRILYDKDNDVLYVTGKYCLRRIDVDPGDSSRSVSTLAGTCGTSGTLGDWDGITFHNGAFYLITGSNEITKITTAGAISTFNVTRPETPTAIWNCAYGCNMSSGEDANTIYIADSYGSSPAGNTMLKLDLTTNVLTRIAGVIRSADTYSRHGLEYDGPALTHVGSPGGMRGIYSPFYDKVLIWGQDCTRIRWLTEESGADWVKTILLKKRPGYPEQSPKTETIWMGEMEGEQANLSRLASGPPIPNVKGIDDRGGVYIGYSRNLNIVWRAYNSTFGGTE